MGSESDSLWVLHTCDLVLHLRLENQTQFNPRPCITFSSNMGALKNTLIPYYFSNTQFFLTRVSNYTGCFVFCSTSYIASKLLGCVGKSAISTLLKSGLGVLNVSICQHRLRISFLDLMCRETENSGRKMPGMSLRNVPSVRWRGFL